MNPYMVFHLLNNIYSWKKKHTWYKHTTLGRRGGVTNLAKKKSSTLSPWFWSCHPLVEDASVSCLPLSIVTGMLKWSSSTDISGVPRIGETAIMHAVVRELKHMVEQNVCFSGTFDKKRELTWCLFWVGDEPIHQENIICLDWLIALNFPWKMYSWNLLKNQYCLETLFRCF